MSDTISVPVSLIERAAQHIVHLHETIVHMGGVIGKTGTLDDLHEALLAHRITNSCEDAAP